MMWEKIGVVKIIFMAKEGLKMSASSMTWKFKYKNDKIILGLEKSVFKNFIENIKILTKKRIRRPGCCRLPSHIFP